MEFNLSFVVAEIFNVSGNASETRAFIFLNACSTCLKEYQQSNIFRLSIVQALALKDLFGRGLSPRTWLVNSFSWCILPFPFMVFGEPQRLGSPSTSYFCLKSKWPSEFLNKYQIALFLLARSIYLVRTCWNEKQPVFGYALACLTELHTVVFGTHPGRVGCRVTISCESPAAPN